MTSMQLRYPLQFVEIPMPKETLGPTAQAHHNGRFHSWVTLFQACCSGPTTKGHASESSEIHIDTARKTAVLQSENPRRVDFCASPCTTACTPALPLGALFLFPIFYGLAKPQPMRPMRHPIPESSQISWPPASFDMASSRNMTSLGRSASICGRSLRAPPGLTTRPFTWVYLALPGWSQAITTKP